MKKVSPIYKLSCAFYKRKSYKCMTQVCPRASQIWDQPSSQPLKVCEEARSSHVLAYSLSGFPMATMVMKLRVHSEMKAHGQYSELYFPFHVSKFMGRYPLVPKHDCSPLGYLCQLQTNMDTSKIFQFSNHLGKLECYP